MTRPRLVQLIAQLPLVMIALIAIATLMQACIKGGPGSVGDFYGNGIDAVDP